MIQARKYKHSITLSLISVKEDDYGKGKIAETKAVLNTFAAVSQYSNDRTRYENTEARQTSMRFTIRWTDRHFNTVEYKGKQYVVESVINVNEANEELIINAQRVE